MRSGNLMRHTKTDMEQDYVLDARKTWDAFVKRIPVLIAVSLVVAITGYGVVIRLPVSYVVHGSYVVSQEGREVAPGFRFDGYYALSATDLFTGTLAAWIVSPETVVRAYQEASVSLPTEDPIDLVKSIRAEKVAPQLIAITVKNSSKAAAEKLASGVARIVPELVTQYNTTGTPAATFAVVASQPWTGVSRIAPFPVALVLFLFVFLTGMVWTMFLEALRRGSS